MKRFSLIVFCLAMVGFFGFWSMMTHAERPRNLQPKPGRSSEHEPNRSIGELEQHWEQLIYEAHQLDRAGIHKKAAGFRLEAEKIEQHLHQMRQQMQNREYHEGETHRLAEAEKQRDYLIQAAENLQQAGKPEMAKAIRHEAEEIERHLHHTREQMQKQNHSDAFLEPLVHELRDLHKEVAGLRKEIHELRAFLDQEMKKREVDSSRK